MKTTQALALLSSIATTSFAGMPAPTPVDLELSLVTDVSGSVSSSEFNLMMDGYEAAFRSSAVHSAITSGAQGSIAVNVVFFASSASEGVPFIQLSSAGDSDSFANILDSFTSKPFGGGTDIGSGIDLAVATINGNNYDGTRQVIDVAGDGSADSSSDATAADDAVAAGIDTINGIAIDDNDGSVEQSFRDNLIRGDGAFVASADTFEDFRPEIERKIIAEIIGQPVDGAPVLAAARQTAVMSVRQMFNDVNARLLRARAGYRPDRTTSGVAAVGDAGFMAEPSASEERRYEFFGSINYEDSEFDRQTGTAAGGSVLLTLPGFEIDAHGGTVGLEYHLTSKWSVGAAVSALDGESTLDRGAGEVDFDERGVSAYATYYGQGEAALLGRQSDIWGTFLAGHSWGDYDTKRRTLSGTARGDTDTNTWIAEFSGGLNRQDGAWKHGPVLSFRYIDGEFDDYTETGPGARAYEGPEFDSLTGSLGYQASYYADTELGLIIPQIRVAAEHDFENDDTTVAGVTLGGAPDENVAVVGLGVLWEISDNIYATADYEGRFASDTEIHRGVVRIGIPF